MERNVRVFLGRFPPDQDAEWEPKRDQLESCSYVHSRGRGRKKSETLKWIRTLQAYIHLTRDSEPNFVSNARHSQRLRSLPNPEAIEAILSRPSVDDSEYVIMSEIPYWSHLSSSPDRHSRDIIFVPLPPNDVLRSFRTIYWGEILIVSALPVGGCWRKSVSYRTHFVNRRPGPGFGDV